MKTNTLPALNKKKIINDPVYGFITIPSDLIYDLIQHPYFQRLRNIRQLGLTNLVYPGAIHTRFHHALGALHLMCLAIETLRSKGHTITHEEEQAVTIAILLHDIGHGPFSHALEHTIVEGVSHEHISIMLMNDLNIQFGGQLEMAIAVFQKKHHKKFLSQLVSGQLDLDRMDYLNRDSFFTGVSEGVISFDRIIKMLDVVDDELVVEEKGIYSVEKFLIARRLMYWQVYLHKTVVAAELLLVKILKRARELALGGHQLFATPYLRHFLYHTISRDDFEQNPENLRQFSKLDDFDIYTSVKVWADEGEMILSTLCRKLIDRNLYKVELSNKRPSASLVNLLIANAAEKYGLTKEEASYFVFIDTVQNNAYKAGDGNINILMKNGHIEEITQASDNSNLEALDKTVKKYILCYDKELKLFNI